MNAETVQSDKVDGGAHVRLPVPVGDSEAFRHGATADVLHLLVDNPGCTFTNRELHRVTGRGMSGVNAAVDALEALGLATVDRTGRANAVRITRERLVKPDDPVTVVAQSEYHGPIRELLKRLEQGLSETIGVVLFGSVARGEADRKSDIDLLVVVEEERMHAQRVGHRVEQGFADDPFDGERYEAHIVVETVKTALSHDHIWEILTEGITLRDSPALEAVKEEAFYGES